MYIPNFYLIILLLNLFIIHIHLIFIINKKILIHLYTIIYFIHLYLIFNIILFIFTIKLFILITINFSPLLYVIINFFLSNSNHLITFHILLQFLIILIFSFYYFLIKVKIFFMTFQHF